MRLWRIAEAIQDAVNKHGRDLEITDMYLLSESISLTARLQRLMLTSRTVDVEIPWRDEPKPVHYERRARSGTHLDERTTGCGADYMKVTTTQKVEDVVGCEDCRKAGESEQ